jgi:hypothetical protein
VVPTLQEVDPVVAHEVDDAVFLRQPARPEVRAEMAKRLRLADPGEWLADNRLN